MQSGMRLMSMLWTCVKILCYLNQLYQIKNGSKVESRKIFGPLSLVKCKENYTTIITDTKETHNVYNWRPFIHKFHGQEHLRYKKKLLQRWNRGKYVVLRVGSLGKIKKKDYTTIMANINVNIHKTRNPARRTQCYLHFTFVNCI